MRTVPAFALAPAALSLTTVLAGCPLTDDYTIAVEGAGSEGVGSSGPGGGPDSSGSGASGSGNEPFGTGGEAPDGADGGGGGAETTFDSGGLGLGGAVGAGGGAGGSSGAPGTPSDDGGFGGAPLVDGSAGATADATSAGSGGGENLVSNADFEAGATGWKVFGGGTATVSVSNLSAHGGVTSLFVSGRTQQYQGPDYPLPLTLDLDATYQASVWIRLPDGYGSISGFNLTIRSLCGLQSTYAHFLDDATVSSSWTELSGTGSIPACVFGTLSSIDFYVEGPATVGAFYIDDVTFARVDDG